MQIIAIAQHELLKLFGTRRGWVSIMTFLLVWGVILAFIIEPAARFLTNPEFGGLIAFLVGDNVDRFLKNWATLEVSLYWSVALYVLPFFAILVAADQMASDRTRGSLRYLLLRCGRLTLFFSRFLGQLFSMVVLVAVTYLSAIAMTAIHSTDRAALMVPDTLPIVVNLWLVLMPYVALMALLSVLARSARQAILYSIIASILLWIILRIIRNKFETSSWVGMLDWVLPGAQIRGLLRLSDWETLQLAPIPLVHTGVLLLLGAFFMWRRDL